MRFLKIIAVALFFFIFTDRLGNGTEELTLARMIYLEAGKKLQGRKTVQFSAENKSIGVYLMRGGVIQIMFVNSSLPSYHVTDAVGFFTNGSRVEAQAFFGSWRLLGEGRTFIFVPSVPLFLWEVTNEEPMLSEVLRLLSLEADPAPNDNVPKTLVNLEGLPESGKPFFDFMAALCYA